MYILVALNWHVVCKMQGFQLQIEILQKIVLVRLYDMYMYM